MNELLGKQIVGWQCPHVSVTCAYLVEDECTPPAITMWCGCEKTPIYADREQRLAILANRMQTS